MSTVFWGVAGEYCSISISVNLVVLADVAWRADDGVGGVGAEDLT